MIESPPRFGSKRFREILLPALRGGPAKALTGLYFMATRRRIRGWSQLMVAAAAAPLNYLRWTRSGEVRAFDGFRRGHALAASPTEVVVLLLGKGEIPVDLSGAIASIHVALDDISIYSTAAATGSSDLQPLPRAGSLNAMVSFLAARHPTAWLLPLAASDSLSPAFGDIFQRLPKTSFAYWDEDRLVGGSRSDPWIKPDWDPLLFGRVGGLCGASAVSLAVAQRVSSGLPQEEISADAVERLLFTAAEIGPRYHIPLVLTHREKAPARVDALSRDTDEPHAWPSVSIIVPTRDRPNLLAACLDGIGRTNYPGNVQTIIVDNGSRDPEALRLLSDVEHTSNSIVLRDTGEFNFSRLNNVAAERAAGEYLCFMNNDVEPIEDDWLTRLISYAAQEDAGAVGAQLLYPDGRIQHAGVVVGLGGAAGHVQKGVIPSERSFRTWHAETREVSAVTAAVMVVKKSAFVHVGGFDEDAFPVAFNDVDLCLRLKKAGLRNIYVAEARLIHHESVSRGSDRAPAESNRFAAELARLQQRWETRDYLDPHFSPLFSRLVERCVLAP